MPYVRVQFERSLAGAPPLGKWDIYSTAWFDAPDVDPSPTVRALFQRLFLGLPVTGGNVNLRGNQLIQGAGGARIKVWEYVVGTLVLRNSYSDSLLSNNATVNSANIALPTQACMAIGYRTEVNVPRQRGRTRFFIGPIYTRTDKINWENGGLRFNSAVIDQQAQYAADVVGALTALGWVLTVKSLPLAFADFNPAYELYVDDVVDIQRSRRTWQAHQERILL